jgi:hypothetical protein
MAKNIPSNTAKTPAHGTDWAGIVYSLYLALVCAISLCVGVFSGAGMLQTGVDMLVPPETYIEKSKTECNPALATPNFNGCTQRELTASEVATTTREAQKREHNQRLRELLHSLITVLVSLGVFGFHWPLFRKRVK